MQDEKDPITTQTDEEETVIADDVQDEDISYEEEDENSSPKDTIKKLREKLKTAIEEKQAYLNNWQRDKAEFVNARKRDEEDKKNLLKYAEAGLISELIPTLDAFDMAMANKEAWAKVDANWRTGVEYIYSQINNTLQSHGLAKIDPKGQVFDPTHHHSVALVETPEKDMDGKVIEVIAYGYTLNGKTIREPQVKVGEYKQ